MSSFAPPELTFEKDQGQRRLALGLGIASIFCCVFGPLALFLGIRAHRRAPDGRATAAMLLGGASSAILLLVLLASSVGFGIYLAAPLEARQQLVSAISPLKGLGRAISLDKPHHAVERVQLSADQKRFVTEYGWPDTFILNLEPDGQRIEIWQYLQCNSDDVLLSEHFRPCRISFIDGKFRNVQTFEGTFAPADLGYRPTEFVSSLTMDEVKEAYGRPSLTRDPKIEGAGRIDILYYRRGITFMFHEGRLWGVVTIAGGTQS